MGRTGTELDTKSCAEKEERAQECLDRGLVLALFGDADDAIRLYRKAVLVDPDNTLGHYMLGVALMKRGNCVEAVEEWTVTARSTREGSQAVWARRQARKLLDEHGGH
jgi:Flp pilus assembly protein TadD